MRAPGTTATDAGYAIATEVFTAREMTSAIDALAAADLQRTKAGARHVLSVPVVRDMAGDPRLRELASVHLQSDAVPFRATLFDKSPSSNWLVVWHQDTALPLTRRLEDPAWGPWSTKAGILYAHAPAWALEQVIALRVHLDDSVATNGPLRVLPGTHRRGVLSEHEIGQLAHEDVVDCLAPRGGVVAMRPLTVHASSKATDDRARRVLHIEYAPSLYLRPGIELALA